MKKIIVMLALLSASIHYSQIGIGNDPGPRGIASPAMASIAKYSDMPVSLASGTPEIGIPLLTIPLADKGINYPLSLSYNLENLSKSKTTGDVGAGWTFFGTGVIFKKIIDGLDECFDRPDLEGHVNNNFDDLYYYNFPGGSGRFRIKRDVVSNTFSLINLTPDHLKIEYTRDNTNLATFKADGFTITSDDGYKYLFNEFDYGRHRCRAYINDPLFSYKPAYFLTKIISPLGIEVATMEYDKKYDEYNNKYCKLKSITSPNGVVQLNYVYDEALKTTVNDPYSLQGITLKNLAGETIYSYELNYTINNWPDKVEDRKRSLNYVRKKDKSGQKIEQTTFIYNASGGLNKIIFPTGGTTEYTYENNEKFINYNDPVYLESLDRYGFDERFQYEYSRYATPFNTEQSLTHNFTISGDAAKDRKYKLFLRVEEYIHPPSEDGPGIPGDPNFPSFPIPVKNDITFKLKRNNVLIKSVTVNHQDYAGKEYEFTNYPGNYTMEIIPTGGAKGSGSFSILDRAFKPGPYRNAAPANGSRIKNIKFYKNSTAITPERTINYDYESFDLPNSTSGYEFYNEADKWDVINQKSIVYKNVKVFETGKGYTKNRFYTADDFPKYITGGSQYDPTYFWPYYRITKPGLPFKKEIYNEQNILLASEETNYELDYYSTDEYALASADNKISSRPAYVKKTSNKSTVYYPNGKKMETSSETQFDGTSFKPVYSKSEADGDVMEKFMTYPVNLPEYSHLEAAYMTGSPVIVEGKQNGKTISKAITKFTVPSLLPTSMTTVNALGESREDMKMEVYDSQGNLIQYRGLSGVPVTLIYGYNKTQVIAKIEGATLAQVSPYTADIIAASNTDQTTTNAEPSLIQALDLFRKNPALASYPITTYTYDPLIGLTSMTSPAGMKALYEYDSAGRLKTTERIDLDASGAEVPRKISEYQYNYKQ
ncbi:hypothetical protein KB553_07840 [Chryseobacterium rhizoplanae]|uniref:hypothetical protein n=1 Tax=Chryseobacterium rhizoplanae TaxID=1609531 RepID=UPI001CE39B39|nr:hypothetical protein [Chryseobacterium rhizoplanae]UCA59041.1 hypothetical protein KB553_18685 [Chryseobacterium rhizoplanae]UCA61436.1 hypothetical protein KB553_07840 [Chryseobacterium rhizoplanae]